MVRGFIEVILGEVGRNILFFYEEHALILNLLVLTYGCTILMSWLTLTRIYRYLVVEIAKLIHTSKTINKDSNIKKIISAIDIPWDVPVSISKFPFISPQMGLYPIKKSSENIKNLLDEEELVNDAIAVLKGKNPQKITPRYRKMQEKKDSLRKKKK